MNVRLTIDVPVQHLPGLERALSAQTLAIVPYIKAGVQRWRLDKKLADRVPSVPETIIAVAPEVDL